MPIDAKSKLEMSSNIAIVNSSSPMPQILFMVNLYRLIIQIPIGSYFHKTVALKNCFYNFSNPKIGVLIKHKKKCKDFFCGFKHECIYF